MKPPPEGASEPRKSSFVPSSANELRSHLQAGFLAVARRPIDLPPPELPSILAGTVADTESVLGAYYAGLAYYANASVRSFERIVLELEADGAPAQHRMGARAAARAAINHGSLLGELAARHGTPVPPLPHAQPLTEDDLLRSLLDRAQENIVEGCVREAYGAVVAWHQALAADDSLVRKVFAIIAHDGTALTEFACDLRSWFDTRLTSDAKAVLRDAERAAIDELRVIATINVSPVLNSVAGAPSHLAAAALVDQLAETLWSR